MKLMKDVKKSVLTTDCAGYADLKRKERRKLWRRSLNPGMFSGLGRETMRISRTANYWGADGDYSAWIKIEAYL